MFTDCKINMKMRKRGKRVAVAVLCGLCGMPVMAQDKPFSLQEVLVVSQKSEMHSEAFRLITQVTQAEIETLPIQTVADILQYLPGIDVRTRGANGGQADISMRGGTFDQVLVMINGVDMSDFHTGHYALNLPITPAMIDRIEVLQGTSAHLHGAFSGAINIITKDNCPGDKEIDLRLDGGMNGLVHPQMAAVIKAKGERREAKGVEAKGERREAKGVTIGVSADYARADGYLAPAPTEKEAVACRNSDYQLANVYLQTRWKGLDVQAGAQWKDAGLGMGYGFGSQDQFDATRTAFASARYAHRWGAWRLDAQAAYRANHDRYEWHRGQEAGRNKHFSQAASAEASAHYASRIGTTSFGAGVRNEHIRSTNLVPEGNRFHVRYFAEQTFYYAGLSASVGINGTYNTQFGHHLGGCANIGYTFADAGTVYANANRSLRMPTFTDLYYNAGNQLGNPDLKPEEAWLLSLGYKGEWGRGEWREARGEWVRGEGGRLTVAADVFYRWGRNIIDWVYVATDSKRPYHAQNQQRVNAAGAELSLAYRLNEWLRCVAVDYAYTYLDLNLKEAGSRYLDYLSHKLTIRLEHGIYKGFGASWTVRFMKREGQFNNAEGAVEDYRPVWLLDGSVYWQNSALRISAECTNMTHTRYYDYGGVLQPGAWTKVCIQATL